MKYYCTKYLNFFDSEFNKDHFYSFKKLYSDDIVVAMQFVKYQFRGNKIFDFITIEEFEEHFISENKLRKKKLSRLNILSQK